jgi:uncharacterized protein DUF7033
VRLLLGEWLGLSHALVLEEREDVSITATAAAGEVVLPDLFLATRRSSWLHPESLPSEPIPVWPMGTELEPMRLVDPRLPVLFGREVGRGTYVQIAPGRIELGLDVFGSVFFAVSRYEEAVPGPRDAHGRFPDERSLAVRARFADRPIANEYAEVLWAALRALWPRLARRARTFRFLPSHDVDFPFCRERSPLVLARRLGADVLIRRDLELAARRVAIYTRGPGRGPKHDLCDTYEVLMRLSEEAGTASTFHFFGDRTGLAIDADYAPSDPAVREVLRGVAERGHEVALHASYEAVRDADVIRRQLDGLSAACRREGVRQEAWGSRNHYLRWEAAATWQALQEAGLAYDATVGFSSIAGFRAGCCYEFPVFNLLARRELRLRERPLIAMEVALLDRQRLVHDEAVEQLVLLARRCRLFGGDFTLLWHNSRLQRRGDSEAYAAVLRAVAER